MHTELSWAANRGERSTSGAKNARWRKQAAPKYGCDRVRCSPNGCDALQQSSGALHCIVGRRGRDESYGCIPLSRAPGTITSLAPRRPARRPLRRARLPRRPPQCEALQRRAHGHELLDVVREDASAAAAALAKRRRGALEAYGLRRTAAGACRLLFSYRCLATATARSESRRPPSGATENVSRDSEMKSCRQRRLFGGYT